MIAAGRHQERAGGQVLFCAQMASELIPSFRWLARGV
jgi:hypothetical protein